MAVTNDAEFSEGSILLQGASEASPEKYFWKPHLYLAVNVKCTFWSVFFTP